MVAKWGEAQTGRGKRWTTKIRPAANAADRVWFFHELGRFLADEAATGQIRNPVRHDVP